MQVVREHYLRDDISSGSPLDPECDAESAKLSADAKQYLVVDTNVALQQVSLCAELSLQLSIHSWFVGHMLCWHRVAPYEVLGKHSGWSMLFASLQMDLLENPALEDVIILSVVLEEVKHRNASAYQRLRKLCADPARRFFVFANENHRCHEVSLCREITESSTTKAANVAALLSCWQRS